MKPRRISRGLERMKPRLERVQPRRVSRAPVPPKAHWCHCCYFSQWTMIWLRSLCETRTACFFDIRERANHNLIAAIAIIDKWTAH
jgi:hypothetical protein